MCRVGSTEEELYKMVIQGGIPEEESFRRLPEETSLQYVREASVFLCSVFGGISGCIEGFRKTIMEKDPCRIDKSVWGGGSWRRHFWEGTLRPPGLLGVFLKRSLGSPGVFPERSPGAPWGFLGLLAHPPTTSRARSTMADTESNATKRCRNECR